MARGWRMRNTRRMPIPRDTAILLQRTFIDSIGVAAAPREHSYPPCPLPRPELATVVCPPLTAEQRRAWYSAHWLRG